MRTLVHDEEGLNTGTLPVAIEPITPAERFFTRSHAPAPEIEAASWELQIGGGPRGPLRISLSELRNRFPERAVTATLCCAGLRRAELLEVRDIPGELPWGSEALGTGVWSGVALRDLLEDVGVPDGTRFVEFIGADVVERKGSQFGFGASIEIEKALSGEVLLATALNGGPLPAAQGFPVRALVPGWVGARSVKWLREINLRSDPSDNYFQAESYRILREPDQADPRSVQAGVAMTEIPMNSVIESPAAGDVVTSARFTVRGWAIGQGGRPLRFVDLSTDGGLTWAAAKLTEVAERWSWVLWEREVTIAPGEHVLVVRAADEGGATQPSELRQSWNVRGYGNNAWHRVRVRCV